MSGRSAHLWGNHFPGLENVAGVNDIATEHGADIGLRLREAVRDRSIVMVTGRPGIGKTFAVARAADDVLAYHPDVTVVWLEMVDLVQGKGLALDLLEQICGTPPHSNTPLRELRPLAATELSARRRLLVIDEAHHVQVKALQLLRWWHQRPNASFSMVLVGTPELEQRIPDDLSSRIMSDIRVSAIDDDEAPGLLARYHRHFVPADPELLSQLNRTEARGQFRWWCKFLIRLDPYLRRTGETLNVEIADAICFELRKGTWS